jgi:MoxR-like ATPase
MNAVEDISVAEKQIDRFAECYQALSRCMDDVLIGQAEVVRLLTIGVLSGGHMLLIGVPGLAKTMMAKLFAKGLGCRFSRIQFTPDLMPADITGTEILQTQKGNERRELVFHKGPIFTNLLLADEINRTPPKTQAALLEAMQETAVTAGGKTFPLQPPFVVIATQNPIEQEGTYPLPEAQLDRFFMSITVDYPSREAEMKIAGMPARQQLPDIAPVTSPEELLALSDIIDHVPVSKDVLTHAVAITSASRPKHSATDDYVRKYVAWGAGPRATQHLMTAAKTAALADGRPSPEKKDLHVMALPVLRHRIIPNYAALGDGIDSSDIVNHLINR